MGASKRRQRAAAASAHGSQPISASGPAKAAGGGEGAPGVAQRLTKAALEPDDEPAGASSASTLAADVSRPDAQGTRPAVHQRSPVKARPAGHMPVRIAPVPPQGHVAGLLPGGQPTRLLRFLRVRCTQTGNSIWQELLDMLEESVDRAQPRGVSHETRMALAKMQLQLSVNTLLSMLEDSQSLQLSALALAALAQLLVGLTEDDIDVMRMRWAAASQIAAWQQAAEQQPPAGQQQAAEHQQVPTPCGPDQQQTGADEEQQHCQSPKQQQAASPQRAAKRTLKAYRRQLDEVQAQPQEIVDEPLKVDRLLRALAPYVAACMKRPGLLTALDRLGGCEMAPRLVFLLWHVYGELGDAWHDLSAAVLRYYIPQLADPSTPAGKLGADSPVWGWLVDILHYAAPKAVWDRLAADSGVAPALLQWTERLGQALDALDAASAGGAAPGGTAAGDAAADPPPGRLPTSTSEKADADAARLVADLVMCVDVWGVLQGDVQRHKPHMPGECTLLVAAFTRMIRHIGSSPGMPAMLFAVMRSCMDCALIQHPAEGAPKSGQAAATFLPPTAVAPAAVAALAAAVAAQLRRCCREVDAAASPAAAAATAAQMMVLANWPVAIDSLMPPLHPGSRRALAQRLLLPLAALRRCGLWLDAGEAVRGLPPATTIAIPATETSCANGPETLGVHAELAAEYLAMQAATSALQLLVPTAAGPLGQDPAEYLAACGFFAVVAARLRRAQLAAWHVWPLTGHHTVGNAIAAAAGRLEVWADADDPQPSDALLGGLAECTVAHLGRCRLPLPAHYPEDFKAPLVARAGRAVWTDCSILAGMLRSRRRRRHALAAGAVPALVAALRWFLQSKLPSAEAADEVTDTVTVLSTVAACSDDISGCFTGCAADWEATIEELDLQLQRLAEGLKGPLSAVSAAVNQQAARNALQ